jgi:hypothetical protein
MSLDSSVTHVPGLNLPQPNNALQRTRRQSLRSFLLAAERDIVIRRMFSL